MRREQNLIAGMQSAACVICNELEQQEKRRFFTVFFLCFAGNINSGYLILKTAIECRIQLLDSQILRCIILTVPNKTERRVK
nr:MAG TPA: hypothetical protein [Caudoviricetes sp.]